MTTSGRSLMELSCCAGWICSFCSSATDTGANRSNNIAINSWRFITPLSSSVTSAAARPLGAAEAEQLRRMQLPFALAAAQLSRFRLYLPAKRARGDGRPRREKWGLSNQYCCASPRGTEVSKQLPACTVVGVCRRITSSCNTKAGFKPGCVLQKWWLKPVIAVRSTGLKF